jgi:Ca-activated chloride channel family protein
MRAQTKITSALVGLLLAALLATGQSGRQPGLNTSGDARDRALLLNVVAAREGDPEGRVTQKDIALYDAGTEQTIQTFTPDPTPARIVLLVDNSLGLRADVEKLQKATREFAYEIYEGDQVMVIGYDKQAEIVAEWTDDAKKIEAALPAFRKQGEPHLFDALAAVVNDALAPLAGATRKRVIVLVADGLDRGSKSSFEQVLKDLQRQDITVYALQIPDRTGGALRRDRLKPAQVIQKLIEGTGGRVLSANEPREAAQSICDELRKHRYLLAYTPASIPLLDTRRLLIVPNEGVSVRHKLQQPGN